MELAEIRAFDSPGHFQNFRESIEGAIASGQLTPVAVEVPYGSLMFNEEWFRTDAGQVWRLVEPDFPFKGVFEEVRT